ncbi:GNAT family N-acetyltransferase [Streptosporangium sp. NPDC000563]|uniref:GNAT family N-acetyltransferase n=1 Tax=unclassified Streptosporangium TaxID=2632669 RepID=UPI0033178CA5
MTIPCAFRAAEADDLDFLEKMLVEAVNWLPERNLSRERILSDPGLAHYVVGWPRPDDLGVIAVGADKQPLGAAWLRRFTAEDPGYGYVADDVPELTVGVLAGWRGRGIGRALLRELIQVAGKRGISRISLSVERANRAAMLYTDEGFTIVKQFEDSDTMLFEVR